MVDRHKHGCNKACRHDIGEKIDLDMDIDEDLEKDLGRKTDEDLKA
jgi:hypothetical protein